MSALVQGDYVARVLTVLQGNPTAADLDFLVSAHASIGYLAATTETDAEMAEAQRKYDEATASAAIREAAITVGSKLTADMVAATVAIQTFDSKKAEIKAYERARKLKNLLESVTQAIHAVKFLGRYDAPGTHQVDTLPSGR